ncbi:MAG: DUF4111 domain-containing protein [Clostridia bacterium]|nr:DUF4111 domain-containing protein [Clostridia bacterium]
MIRKALNLSGVTPMSRKQSERLVNTANQFSSRVIFEHRTRVINGKSMLGILCLGVTGNDPVFLITDGEDEEAACKAICALLEGGVLPPKNYTDAVNLTRYVKERYLYILQDNLVGIYLHGSLAARCFLWEHSDIDFLVVVRKRIPIEKKIELVELLYSLGQDAPPEGFEMSVVLEKYCSHIPYPIPFELHYSNMHRRDYERDVRGFCSRMHGEDPDLTCHIAELHAYGIALYGPSVPRVFDRPKREDVLCSIRQDVQDAAEHLHEKPVYYVLNLCRAVAFERENLMLSKKEGGQWALKHMESCHQRVIQAALNAYETGLGMSYDEGQAENFCYDALSELSDALG